MAFEVRRPVREFFFTHYDGNTKTRNLNWLGKTFKGLDDFKLNNPKLGWLCKWSPVIAGPILSIYGRTAGIYSGSEAFSTVIGADLLSAGAILLDPIAITLLVHSTKKAANQIALLPTPQAPDNSPDPDAFNFADFGALRAHISSTSPIGLKNDLPRLVDWLESKGIDRPYLDDMVAHLPTDDIGLAVALLTKISLKLTSMSRPNDLVALQGKP